MKYFYKLLMILAISAGIAYANFSYTGYSGAPSSNGTCTRSCHAQEGINSSCRISGFPEGYVPNQEYTISVYHIDGFAINQFNCSILTSVEDLPAGLITAGDTTEVYDITNESNGVHWKYEVTDSGSFTWTAPDFGTGTVRLYWAGLQGTRANGADTQIVLTSMEAGNNVEYIPGKPENFILGQNYPNPFNSATTITFRLSNASNVRLEISNILGQKVYSYNIANAQAGDYKKSWQGIDSYGNPLPSGLYFYQLITSSNSLTRKMAIIR